MLLPKTLIKEVEHNLRRASLDGQRVHVAVGRAERGTSRFSNLSLLRYLDIASMLVAARADADSVQGLFGEQSPPFDLSGTLRLRGVTPNVDGTLARRRTTTSNEYYEDRGAEPTNDAPVYIHEAGEFYILGDQKNPSKARASFIEAPLTSASTETSVSLSSGSLGSAGFLAEKHEETVLYLADTGSSAVYTARLLDASSGDVDTSAPDVTYDITYFDHACTRLSPRHKGSVVEMASAFCFASMAEQDALETALSNYGDEIANDVMPAFDLSEQSE